MANILGIAPQKNQTNISNKDYDSNSLKQSIDVLSAGGGSRSQVFGASAEQSFVDDSFMVGGVTSLARAYKSALTSDEPLTQEQFKEKIAEHDLGEFEQSLMHSYKEYQGLMTPNNVDGIISSAKRRIFNNALINETPYTATAFFGGLAGGLPDFIIPGVANLGKFGNMGKLAQTGLLAAEGAGIGAVGGVVGGLKAEQEGERVDFSAKAMEGAKMGALLNPAMFHGIHYIGKSITKGKEAYQKYKQDKQNELLPDFIKNTVNPAVDTIKQNSYESRQPIDTFIDKVENHKIDSDLSAGIVPDITEIQPKNNEVWVSGIKIEQPTEHRIDTKRYSNFAEHSELGVKYSIVDADSVNLRFDENFNINNFDPMSTVISRGLVDDMPMLHQGQVDYGHDIISGLRLLKEQGLDDNYKQYVESYAKQHRQDISNMTHPIIVKDRETFLPPNKIKELQKILENEKEIYNLEKQISFENTKFNRASDIQKRALLFLNGKIGELNPEWQHNFLKPQRLKDFPKMFMLPPNKWNSWLKMNGYLEKYTELGYDFGNEALIKKLGLDPKNLSSEDIFLLEEYQSLIPNEKYKAREDNKNNGFFVIESFTHDKAGILSQTKLTPLGAKHFAEIIEKKGKFFFDEIDATNETYKSLSSKEREKRQALKYSGDITSKTNEQITKEVFESRQEKAKEKTVDGEIKPKSQETLPITSAVQDIIALGVDVKVMPKIITRPSEFMLPNGKTLDVNHIIVDVKDIIPSNNIDYTENANYLKDLQPRDRMSKESQIQIEQGANNIDAGLLLYDNSFKNGTPIIGSDLMVESGNGRSLMLTKAYLKGNKGIQKYKSDLIRLAQDLGLDISDIKNPVLVRLRETSMTLAEREKFAKLANSSSELQQGISEQAVSLAKDIDFSIMSEYKGGDIASKINHQFAVNLINKLFNSNDRGKYLQNNKLTNEGIFKIEGLLFEKAYKNKELNALIREQGDKTLVSVSNSLTELAPYFAKLNTNLENKTTSTSYDIVNNLIEAIAIIRNSRKEGVDYREIFKQFGLFEPISPETEYITHTFFKEGNKLNSVGDITESFKKFIQSGFDNTSKTLGNIKELNKMELLQTYLKKDEKIIVNKEAKSGLEKVVENNNLLDNKHSEQLIETIKDTYDDGTPPSKTKMQEIQKDLDDIKTKNDYNDDMTNCLFK